MGFDYDRVEAWLDSLTDDEVKSQAFVVASQEEAARATGYQSYGDIWGDCLLCEYQNRFQKDPEAGRL